MPDSVCRPLYNGNISSMATYIRRFEGAEPALLTAYKYDQLNRLTRQDVYKSFNPSTNSYSGLLGSNMFRERVSYDANGNILTYRRNANGEYENLMDDLTYQYYAESNQLKRVDDKISSGKYGANSWDIILDIDGHLDSSNYVYDAIGNLIQDKHEKITNIKWNVYGKIMEITRNATAGDKVPTTRIRYTYDAQGNRISQVVEKAGSSTKDFTWYVRDAQGNMITTYKASGNVDTTTLNNLVVSKNEHMIYGSSRLGSHPYDFSVDGGPTTRQFYSAGIFERGWRQYELSNHLGNVLTTISDKKIGVSSGAIGTPIDYYDPEIVSATDYYPFGMVSRVATSSTGKDYRFGFNGKENDNGVKGFGNQQDYGMRIYDPRIGRFLSVDPLTREYPWYTPYQFAGNKPIWYVDLDGAEENPPQYLLDKLKVNMNDAPDVFTTKSGANIKTITKDGRKYNSAWAWEQIRSTNGVTFSKGNNWKIDQGISPVSDPHFREQFKVFEKFKNQTLEIHHLNHGATDSYALPWKLHRGKGFTKWWHNFGGQATKVIIATTLAVSLYDFAKGNPMASADLLLSGMQEDFQDFFYDAAVKQDYKGFIRAAEGNNSSKNSTGLLGVYYATDSEVSDIVLNKQFPDLSKTGHNQFVVGEWGDFFTNKEAASQSTRLVITHAIFYFKSKEKGSKFTPIGIRSIE